MALHKPVTLAGVLAVAATVAGLALASVSAAAATVRAHALLHSRELWATIDVCSPQDQPDVVGIRGSMPGTGNAHEHMYMSFRLQYLATGNRWLDVSSGASSGWVAVGAAGSTRQGGTSFDLKPAEGKPPVTLRGVVDFQWRAAGKVLVSSAEPTTAGHKALVGADPAGFSAASCAVG
ncbi:MAG TPA: hypothetical protein VK765_04055 [Solirubrobacteraceae bacterium]|nr:hypothetical protein [Solirubrobacteraceae bacterium]